MEKVHELSKARDYWRWVLNLRWGWFIKLLETKANTEAINDMLQGIRDAEMMIEVISDEIIEWHSNSCISPEVIDL